MKNWQDKYPELNTAREFRDEKALAEFFAPDVIFWYTSAFIGKPCEITGPETCISKVLEKELLKKVLGLYIQIANPWGNSSRFLSDMQNQPGKGIFTSEEKAQAYHEICLDIFNKCSEWQEEHTVGVELSMQRDKYYPKYN